jgi:hypothetical protein
MLLALLYLDMWNRKVHVVNRGFVIFFQVKTVTYLAIPVQDYEDVDRVVIISNVVCACSSL